MPQLDIFILNFQVIEALLVFVTLFVLIIISSLYQIFYLLSTFKLVANVFLFNQFMVGVGWKTKNFCTDNFKKLY